MSHTLLTSNDMISLAVWCTKRFGIFQRQQTAFALRARAILLSFEKITRAY